MSVSQHLMDAVTVFGVVFALDVVWAKYVAAIASKQPVASAAWSVGTIVLSGVAAVKYVEQPWLLIPAGAAAFASTWIVVTRERNREINREHDRPN